MNTPNSQFNNGSTIILKTDLFNDQATVRDSLPVELTNNALTVDISNTLNADFTDNDWDRILDNILLSSKVITV